MVSLKNGSGCHADPGMDQEVRGGCLQREKRSVCDEEKELEGRAGEPLYSWRFLDARILPRRT